MQSAKQFLYCLFVLLPTVGVASDILVPETARKAWDEVLNSVWLKAKPHVAFCLGDREPGVIRTMLESFPDPLPTEPADDPVCSNATRLGEHLCGPKSLQEYYKVQCYLPAAFDRISVSLARSNVPCMSAVPAAD